MASLLKLDNIGAKGVNVDADPASLEDTELRLAQNAIRDPLGVDSGLRKRPGLKVFNLNTVSPDAILGGIGVPLRNASTGGIQFIYIGRGPV